MLYVPTLELRVIIPSQYGHKKTIKNARKPKLNQTLKTSHLAEGIYRNQAGCIVSQYIPSAMVL